MGDTGDELKFDSDIIIIGAGISGINAGYRVQESLPNYSYTILESRHEIGGTWSLLKYPGIAQPKLTDLDSRFWLAPMPLYVSQLRARLNLGSASIRLHRHGSGCIPGELSLFAPSSTFCQLTTPLLPA